MKHLKKGGAKDALLSLFFPSCCPSCGRSVGREENFCPECSRELYIPLPGKLCPRCGKNPCICEELAPPYLHTWAGPRTMKARFSGRCGGLSFIPIPALPGFSEG